MATPTPLPVKPGYKTTEFYLTLLAVIVTAVAPYTTGLPTIAKVLSLVASVLGALGYTIARTSIKNNAL
ncbi:MAG: hypothetical protein NVS1B10_01520 [Candidatus Saccharimonadales bacterium]